MIDARAIDKLGSKSVDSDYSDVNTILLASTSCARLGETKKLPIIIDMGSDATKIIK